MGKKQRLANHLTAFVTLRDMPGTRIMFWVVTDCPYCGGEHLHLAGNLRSADPGDTLGEQTAPCNPEKVYTLELPPRPAKKKKGKADKNGRKDNGGKGQGWDEDW